MAFLGPYPTHHELEARADALTEVAGGEVVIYGRSVEGRPLRAHRVGAGQEPVLTCAVTHGPEFIGAQVALALLEAFAGQREVQGVDALRERASVWVVPCINPDAYVRVVEREGAGTLAHLRANANGVDLNRNWPLPPGARRLPLPGAGSSRVGDATYRGSEPLSEPETRDLDALLHAHPFRASANLHSFMGTFFPARVRDRPGFTGYRRLCRAFAARQKTPYRRLASRVFDAWTGEQEDHQHHALGTWALCVEVFPVRASFRQHVRAPSLFWRFNPHDPEPWIRNDLPGLVAFFRAALEEVHPCADRRPRAT